MIKKHLSVFAIILLATNPVWSGGEPNEDFHGLQTTVDGIDVSHWQGTIDWTRVYNAGYRFAFTKATEGISYTDPTFTTNMNNGCSAGLLMGAYHFARPDRGNSASAEANHFLSVAGAYFRDNYLLPVLDLETGSSLGKTALSNWVHEWMNTVKSYIRNNVGIDIEPIIYVSSNYARNYLDVSVTRYHLWIAHWGVSSPNTGIWSTWDFWQYTDSGTVPGISGNVDLDRYNGNLASLQQNFMFGSLIPRLDAVYNAHFCPSTMEAGSQYEVWVEYLNTGTETWSPGGSNPVRLGTWSPRDRSSAFFTSGDWINPQRPTDVDQTTTPNQVGRFTFIMTAPAVADQVYEEHWRLVKESGEWFGPECVFTIHVQDTIPPQNVTMLVTPATISNIQSPYFDWADGTDVTGISKYCIRIDKEPDPDTTPGYEYEVYINNTGSGSSEHQVTIKLCDGLHYFFIYQIDGAGLWSRPATGAFTIDTTPPAVEWHNP